MVPYLTRKLAADGEADRIIVKPRKSPGPGADPKQPPNQQPKQQVAPLRWPLSFRAVNLPSAPGYDPGFQRHHLLPRQLLSKRCFGALFARVGREWLGFDDFRRNGLLLPANDAAALRIGLPLHRGPHREYNAMVIERVGQVEANWASGRRHSPRAALGEAVAGLQMLQQSLRQRLLAPGSQRLALNRCDPLGQGVDFTHIDAMVEALWPDSDPWADESPIMIDTVRRVTAAAVGNG